MVFTAFLLVAGGVSIWAVRRARNNSTLVIGGLALYWIFGRLMAILAHLLS